ncbi:MAG: substrate-binding domain-containing protein [Alkalibacterium sp.]|nr:substrate-binding domain-containing protein [Alkalibacterium sp.]
MRLKPFEAAGLAEEVIVIGIDRMMTPWLLIEDGRMEATIAQQPAEMGRIAMETAYEYFDGEEIEDYIAAPLELITND